MSKPKSLVQPGSGLDSFGFQQGPNYDEVLAREAAQRRPPRINGKALDAKRRADNEKAARRNGVRGRMVQT